MALRAHRMLLAAVVVGTGISVASADQGLYLGLLGGASLPEHSKATASAGGAQATDKVKFDAGPVGGVVAGYAFDNGIQPELEFTYRDNHVKGGGGSANAIGGVASLYYNFTQDNAYFYAGGGAGYTSLKLKVDGAGSDTDKKPIFSAGAGVGFVATNNLLVGLDYRYQGTFSRAKFNYDANGTPSELRASYHGQLAMIGLRYSFGLITQYRPEAIAPRESVRVVPVLGGN